MPLCEWVNATGVMKLFDLSVDRNYRNASPSVHSLWSVSDTEKSWGMEPPSQLCLMHCSVLEGAKTANIWHVALKRVNPNRSLHSGEEKCTSL